MLLAVSENSCVNFQTLRSGVRITTSTDVSLGVAWDPLVQILLTCPPGLKSVRLQTEVPSSGWANTWGRSPSIPARTGDRQELWNAEVPCMILPVRSLGGGSRWPNWRRLDCPLRDRLLFQRMFVIGWD
jgi:hypothetical protein